MTSDDKAILSKGNHCKVFEFFTYPLFARSGAKKLLDAEPLTKMVPVDEFVPIMFDRHPNETWKSRFSNRVGHPLHTTFYNSESLLTHMQSFYSLSAFVLEHHMHINAKEYEYRLTRIIGETFLRIMSP